MGGTGSWRLTRRRGDYVRRVVPSGCLYEVVVVAFFSLFSFFVFCPLVGMYDWALSTDFGVSLAA